MDTESPQGPGGPSHPHIFLTYRALDTGKGVERCRELETGTGVEICRELYKGQDYNYVESETQGQE